MGRERTPTVGPHDRRSPNLELEQAASSGTSSACAIFANVKNAGLPFPRSSWLSEPMLIPLRCETSLAASNSARAWYCGSADPGRSRKRPRSVGSNNESARYTHIALRAPLPTIDSLMRCSRRRILDIGEADPEALGAYEISAPWVYL